jgi:hypothetical protein
VSLHGGRVSVHSNGEGQGSTFKFEIPMRLPAYRNALNEERDARVEELRAVLVSRPLARRRVSLVDDEKDGNFDPAGALVRTQTQTQTEMHSPLLTHGQDGMESTADSRQALALAPVPVPATRVVQDGACTVIEKSAIASAGVRPLGVPAYRLLVSQPTLTILSQ